MVKRGVEWVIVDQGRVEQVRIAQVKRVRRNSLALQPQDEAPSAFAGL